MFGILISIGDGGCDSGGEDGDDDAIHLQAIKGNFSFINNTLDLVKLIEFLLFLWAQWKFKRFPADDNYLILFDSIDRMPPKSASSVGE